MHYESEREVSVPNYATFGSREGGEDVMVGEDNVVPPHLLEVGMRLQYGLRILEVELCNKHKEGKRIHQSTLEEDTLPLFLRKVLVKKQ